jgi:hypothetical protein
MLPAVGIAACGFNTRGTYEDPGSGGQDAQVSSVAVGGFGASPTSTSGSPTSSGGGAGECSVGGDCPGMDDDCGTRTCVAGTCGIDPADLGDSCESGAGECDGNGNCKHFAGEPCAVPAECLTNECADGVCCDTTCDGACTACNLVASVGTCSGVAEATPEPQCNGVCDALGACINGDHLWSRKLGSNIDATVNDVDSDSAGNVIVGGAWSGNVDFGDGAAVAAGNVDAFVAKYNSDGTLLWKTVLGATGVDRVRGVAVLPNDNVVATGMYTVSIDVGGGAVGAQASDIFVVVLNAATGAIVDGRVYGGAGDDLAWDAAVDAAGNVLLGGVFTSASLDFSGSAVAALSNDGSSIRDPFVTKLDDSLNFVWQRSPTVSDDNELWRLATDSQNRVVAVGEFVGNADWGGGNLVNGNAGDAFVASFTSTGAHVWSMSLAGNGAVTSDVVRDVAIAANDDVVITGQVIGGVNFGAGSVNGQGNGDAFYARYSATGSYQSAQRFGDAMVQSGRAVTFDGDGNLIVAGSFEGTVDLGGGAITSLGNEDIYLAKYGASGTLLWSRSYGGTDLDQLWGIASGATGLFLGGAFRGGLNFGAGLTTTVTDPDTDGFLAKLAP